MVSAAEMLEFLQRRAQLQAHRLPPPGEFPAGWQRWFSSMRERVGAVTGTTADAIVELLSKRPLERPPPSMAELTRWKAFTALWRQDWQPASADDARTRLIATIFTAVWHLLFAAMLLWLMYLQYLIPPAPPAGEDVVQVEYIGIGTPNEAGGGAARAEPAAPAEASGAAAAESQPAASAPLASGAPSIAVDLPAPDLAAPAPEIPQLEIPEPQAPAAVAEQPVAVSEPSRTEDPVVFELPPPQPRVAERSLQAPELRMPTRDMQVADVPAPVQPIQPRELTQRPVEARPLAARTPTVTEREIPAPLPRVALPDVPAPVSLQPQLRSETPSVEAREIPAPAARTAQAPPADPTLRPAASSATASTSPAAAASSSSARDPAAASSAQPTASAPPGARPSATATAAPGAGPRAVSAPGAAPSVRRGDDWGDSTRNRPGAQRGERPGLYNSDGSVRVGEPPGSASPGQPPGTVTQEIASLDRAGTWLKRKPTDYEPTTFDRFWRPNETLLEEWVRKGIKQVAIPIPGSSKRIVCVVSLLQFGGGCGLDDPNLNEQPATARPPPDIPFKPHLQEGNGSVPAGG